MIDALVIGCKITSNVCIRRAKPDARYVHWSGPARLCMPVTTTGFVGQFFLCVMCFAYTSTSLFVWLESQVHIAFQIIKAHGSRYRRCTVWLESLRLLRVPGAHQRSTFSRVWKILRLWNEELWRRISIPTIGAFSGANVQEKVIQGLQNF